MVAVLFLSASCDQAHLQQQARVPMNPGISPWDRDLLSRGESEKKSGAKLPEDVPLAQLETPNDLGRVCPQDDAAARQVAR